MSVASVVTAMLDRAAKTREIAKTLGASGTDYWSLADSAGDETFENRLKGTELTAMDTKMTDGSVIDEYHRPLLQYLDDYAAKDLSLTPPTRGKALTTYIQSLGTRVPFDAAEMWAAVFGTSRRLATELVFPKGTRVDSGDPSASGMHKFGTLTGTSGDPTYASIDGALSAYVGGAGVLVTNDAGASTVTDLVMTATRNDDTPIDIALALSGADQYDQTLFGMQPVNAAGAAAGQKTIPINGITGPFKVDERVLIYKADGTQEIGVVASKVTDTSITLVSNLINSYEVADLVIPLFKNLSWKSGSLADGKVLSFWAYPDRIIAQ